VAHAGFLRCSSRISRIGAACALFVLRKWRNVRRRRRRWRSHDVLENPLTAEKRATFCWDTTSPSECCPDPAAAPCRVLTATRRNWVP
jgi:hypothetical protein